MGLIFDSIRGKVPVQTREVAGPSLTNATELNILGTEQASDGCWTVGVGVIFFMSIHLIL